MSTPRVTITATDTPSTVESEWQFPTSPDRKICWIRATTDGKGDVVGDQRVLSFSFQD